ncbi:MAG: zinc ribbon domain-containing protein [Clostridia bacterium]|nr:zinc ribbon domain-containing protein [Clostridia bacterium]
MFCNKCGSPLTDGAKFCSSCGSKIQSEPAKIKCPGCGVLCDADTIYCENCGMLVTGAESTAASAADVQVQPKRDQPDRISVSVQQKQAPTAAGATQSGGQNIRPDIGGGADLPPASVWGTRQTGRLLKKALVSIYMGEVKVGPPKSSGSLYVYDDHLFYSNSVGNYLIVNTFNNGESLIIPFKDIYSVKNSKYMGVFPSMVVTLRNGLVYTFAASVGGDAIPEIVSLVVSRSI